jgi:polar amino acid transport system substrate-binding protein
MKPGHALLLALATPALAWAGCSRPIHADVASMGLSVTVHDSVVGGFYPTLLRTLGEHEGCEFVFAPVPKARQEAMFAIGQTDLMLPASRTSRRDRHGHFVPFVASRAAILSIDHARAPIHSLKELRERKELRVALVRGYDYGDQYQALIKDLTAQGRAVFEPDPVSVARLLQGGMADVSVITPATLGGAILSDKRVEPMFDKLRVEVVEDLPWGMSGMYISKISVSAADRAVIERMVGNAVKSGVVYEGLRKQYPPSLIEGTVRAK